MNEQLSAEYGRYDELSEEVLRKAWAMGAKATGALVIVVGENGSNGFSASVVDPRVSAALPDILRSVAQGIEDGAKARAN